MNATNIREDDIVRCNIRGECFFGEVQQSIHTDESGNRGIIVIPIGVRGPYPRFTKPRQIIAHYRKSKRSLKAG